MSSKSEELRDRARRLANAAYHEFWTTVVEDSEILRQIAPNKRKLWLSKGIEEKYREQNGLCALCNDSLVLGKHEVDHIIPHHYGGGNERANIRLAHPFCNKSRGNRQVDPHDLLQYLEDRYMNL